MKYVLWSIFGAIILLFGIGLASYRFDLGAYLRALQAVDAQESYRHGGIVSLFFPSGILSGSVRDVVPALTGSELLLDSGDDSIGGQLDVYDPAFSQDFGSVTSGSDISSGLDRGQKDTTGDFGFVAPVVSHLSGSDISGTGSSSHSGSVDSKKQLLQLIKTRELIKK